MLALWDWLLEKLVAPVQFAPDSVQRLRKAASEGTLLYVAGTLSILEFLCFRLLLAREGLPVPHAANGLTKRSTSDLFARLLAGGRSVLFFLRKGQPGGRVPTGFDGGYEQAILETVRDPSKPIYAAPLLLVWRDERLRGLSQPAWVDALLGGQEEPGPVRRWLQLLWRRNRAEIIVADLVNVTALRQENAALAPEIQARRLRFEVSGSIERARRARLGPPRKTARRLRQEILRSRRLAASVEDAGRDGDRDRAWQRADSYLREIAANPQPWLLALAHTLLTRIWRRIYEGIEVDLEGLERVRAAARRGPLVLVPSHRSHVDYLIITYVLVNHGLAPPLIAAGANLSFFPMGFLFRRGGGFFLRRTFGGNKLYTQVFREYIRKMLHEGYSLEFFIEGGRSRTGKLLRPKLGLLGIIVDVTATGGVREPQIVPVSIAYDKVIEESSYADELAGGEKKPENIGAVLRARRVLTSNYGRLYLHFDEPFSLPEEMARARHTPAEDAETSRSVVVQRVAHRILWGITRASVVTPTALVAAALLATGKRGVARADFLRDATYLFRRARASAESGAGGRLAPALLDDKGELELAALERSVDLLENDGDIQIRGTVQEPIYVVPEDRRLHLDYYRNTALHALAADALLAAGLMAARRHNESDDQARAKTLALSRLLKNELVYEVGRTFDQIYDQTWNRLQRDDSLAQTDRLELLAGLLRDFIESYYVTAVGLAEGGGKTNHRELLALGERLYLEGRYVTRREALSKANFENALESLRSGGVPGNPEAIRYFLE